MPTSAPVVFIEVLAAAGILAAGGGALSGDPSMFSLVGAGLAAFLSMVRNWRLLAEMPRRISVFVGVFGVGGLAPGGILKTWWPDIANTLGWEAWFLAAVVAGIFAWPIMEALYIVGDYIPGLARRRAKRMLDKTVDRIFPESKGE